GSPVFAWAAYAVTLWLWHIPALYQATLDNEVVHAAQHISFLIASLLFWSVLFEPGRARRSAYGTGVIYIFTTALHGSVLGALLTFSRVPWFPTYAPNTEAWGISLLDDQQLAGLIMWVPHGFLYL